MQRFVQRDATELYQNSGTAGVWEGEEARENLRLAGGRRRLSTMLEATHFFGQAGIEEKKGHRMRRVERFADGLARDARMGLLDWTRPARRRLNLKKKE